MMKKILSLALALVMCAALVIPAFAEAVPGAPADPNYETIRQHMANQDGLPVAVPDRIYYRPSSTWSGVRNEGEEAEVKEQVLDDGAPADSVYEEIRQFMADPSEKTIAKPDEIRYIPAQTDHTAAADANGAALFFISLPSLILPCDAVAKPSLLYQLGFICQGFFIHPW